MNNNNQLKQPTIADVQAAFRNAENHPEIQTLLHTLYGDAVEPDATDNRPVTERIKTFDDAVAALGNHALVNQYRRITEEQNPPMNETATDIIAYMKLRIIVAALNEGWEPEFVEDERRWAPWFVLYTNEEIERMDDDVREKICRVVGRSSHNANANGGLAYAYASNASSDAYSNDAARLAFKTEALAKYAGTQFIEIYRDFIIAR
jgi:hypothetical protein